MLHGFRHRDRAAGGTGHPITAAADFLLFRIAREDRGSSSTSARSRRVLLIPAGGKVSAVVGFEAGPGNQLLDAIVFHGTRGKESTDPGGKKAVQGRCLEPLLARWLEHPHLTRTPPKAVHPEAFGRSFLLAAFDAARQLGRRACPTCSAPRRTSPPAPSATRPERGCRLATGPRQVLLTGGGVRNGFLWQLVAQQFGGGDRTQRTRPGVPPLARNAAAAAVLAALTCDGVAGNLPVLTGATGGRLLGHIAPGDGRNWAPRRGVGRRPDGRLPAGVTARPSARPAYQLPRQHHRPHGGVVHQPHRAGRHAAGGRLARNRSRYGSLCSTSPPVSATGSPFARQPAVDDRPPRCSCQLPRFRLEDRSRRLHRPVGGEFQHDRREPRDGGLVPRPAIHGRDEVARVRANRAWPGYAGSSLVGSPMPSAARHAARSPGARAGTRSPRRPACSPSRRRGPSLPSRSSVNAIEPVPAMTASPHPSGVPAANSSVASLATETLSASPTSSTQPRITSSPSTVDAGQPQCRRRHRRSRQLRRRERRRDRGVQLAERRRLADRLDVRRPARAAAEDAAGLGLRQKCHCAGRPAVDPDHERCHLPVPAGSKHVSARVAQAVYRPDRRAYTGPRAVAKACHNQESANMKSIRFHAVFAALFLPNLLQAADGPVVLEGKDGPGKGKHIVLISGDEEYRSEETLPQLAKILAKHHGFKCTVLFAVDPKDGTINPNVNDIPGLEALKTADLMVIFTRFRNLPDDQMQHIVDYVDAGKPVVGLRTATHAFNIPKDRKFAKYSCNGSDAKG